MSDLGCFTAIAPDLARWELEVSALGGRAPSLALLGRVGDALVERREISEQDVPFVLLGLPELGVGAVEPIENAEDAETLVEPERDRQKCLLLCQTMRRNRTIKTHLRWWKSWNSGEGRKGRWYPQWEMLVLIRATQYQRVVVAKWEPMITGPITTGSVLEIWQ